MLAVPRGTHTRTPFFFGIRRKGPALLRSQFQNRIFLTLRLSTCKNFCRAFPRDSQPHRLTSAASRSTIAFTTSTQGNFSRRKSLLALARASC